MQYVPLTELLGPGVDPVDQLATDLERLLVERAPVWDHTFDGGGGRTSRGLVVSVSDAARLLAQFMSTYHRTPAASDVDASARTGAANTLHPVHVDVRNAIMDRLAPGSAAQKSLLAVVDLHEPAHWLPHRDFITCGECSILAWPPPADRTTMWSDCLYPCRTIQDIAHALGVDIPPWEVAAAVSVDAAAARSLLGAAEVAALREAVGDDAVAARMVDRHQPREGVR